MAYTRVEHEIRYGLGISSNDYYVLDHISRSQNNPAFSDSGWCTQSHATIARLVRISVLGCKNSVKKLLGMGLVVVNGRKKRVTDIWFVIHETVQKVYQNENANGIETIPSMVYKLYREWYTKYTESGIETIPHNIKTTFKYNINSSKGGGTGSDLNFSSSKNSITDSGTEKKDASQKKKVPGKKKKVTAPVFLFDDTALTDLDYFVAKFSDTDYQFADLDYYRSKLRLWGNENGVELSEEKWLETAKTFMRRDANDGKFIKKAELNTNHGKSKQIINPIQAFNILKSDCPDW